MTSRLVLRRCGFLPTVGVGLALVSLGCDGTGPDAPVVEPVPPVPAAAAEGAPGPGLGQVTGSARAATGVVLSIVLLEPHAEVNVPVPERVATMDQIGRQFVPGFILVRAGQTVNFRNSEDDLHTVHVKDSAGESLFNVATMYGSTYEYTFELGDEYTVICNTHTEMFADIMVVDTPYAVIAGRDGSFAIPNVVPGAYTATMIHGEERSEREVEVVSGDNTIDLVSD